MIRENLQICGVEITGKYICETKLNLDIFSHAPRQNSPPVSYQRHRCSSPQVAFFEKSTTTPVVGFGST